MKNYNRPEQLKEKSKAVEPVEQKEERVSLKDKLKDTFKPTDQRAAIDAKIKEQEEKIQALKNSINIYFVDRCEFLNVRDDQSKEAQVLGILKSGELIEPVIYNDTVEWTKVKYKGKTGYIMTKYIGVEVSQPVE